MEYVYVGKLVNTHGLKGEVKLLSNFDYKDYEQFVILEKDDVNELIEILIWAKEGCERRI